MQAICLNPIVPRCFHPCRLGILTAFVTLLTSSTLVSDDEPRQNSDTSPASEQVSVKSERFLGVVTEPVSEAVAAQLTHVLGANRGLLVTRVLPDSPASKAGVLPFDVLSAADSLPLITSDQLKEHILSRTASEAVKLEYIRGAKKYTVDVQPADRVVSRLVLRHSEPAKDEADEQLASQLPIDDANSLGAVLPAYSIGVRTRDGKSFQVEIQMAAEKNPSPSQKITGSSAEIRARIQALPEPMQRSVTRQIARLSEDRQDVRSVQFRFQPRREGNRQVLAVSLRKPEANGFWKSFEMQQPMGGAAKPLPLEHMLQVPEFTAELKDLDPVIREKIESTLKTASLPAGRMKVEKSQ